MKVTTIFVLHALKNLGPDSREGGVFLKCVGVGVSISNLLWHFDSYFPSDSYRNVWSK